MGCFDFFMATKRKEAQDNLSILSERTLIGHVSDKENVKLTDPKPNVTGPRLESLRRLMEQEGCEFYIVPTEDAHSSEYTAPVDQRRTWISGFTGSAGTAIVAKQSAHLFADGRYHIQAAEQLDENWTLHKFGQTGVKNWLDWLVEQAQQGTKVGFDPALSSYVDGKELVTRLTTQNAQVVFPSRNLVDVAWGDQRPKPIDAPVHVHPLKYAGKSSQEKISDIRKDLEAYPRASAFIVSALDEVAWTLNLRGASIPCNPVFPAYLVVGQDHAAMFVSDALLVPGSQAHTYIVDELKVQVHAYEQIWNYLGARHWTFGDGGDAKIVSGERVSYAVINSVGYENFALVNPSPLALRKAVKNKAELDGMRACHLRDGAAWAKWAAWLEEQITIHDKKIDEYQAAVKFQEIRKTIQLYAGMDSYDAISAAGPNAALPHYEAPEKGSRLLDRHTPYLNDSGAQYFDGTIDCTRTVHFGRPTKEQKRAYTRVLQGHIAIDMAKFPKGTTGAQLDVLARQPLWKDGYNYLHGTGHGVGSFLNVHEGPQGFSSWSGGSKTPIEFMEGMIVSNEPGFYEEGRFGMRIESLIAVTRVETHRGFGGVPWYGFERITQVPIATNLVDYKLLNYDETKWLKDHNAEAKNKLWPLVKDDHRAARWLRKQ